MRPSKTDQPAHPCRLVLDGRSMGSQGSKVSSGENLRKIRSRGYKTFFMLNSAEYEILPSECFKQDKQVIFQYFRFFEHSKFHAQLS